MTGTTAGGPPKRSFKEHLARAFRGIRANHWIALAIAFGSFSVALAIGFDDAELSEYQLKFARLLASVAGGVAVVFSALRYIWERQQELAWQKTTFMVELFKEFEEDKNLRLAQQMVDYSWSSGDESRLHAVLEPHAEMDEDTYGRWRALDRYMDFFDHLYTYIFITGTLDADDVTSFSGYLLDILDSKPLSEFAFKWGYVDVLRLAIHFNDLADRGNLTEEMAKIKLEVEQKRKAR